MSAEDAARAALRRAGAARASATPIEKQRERARILSRYADGYDDLSFGQAFNAAKAAGKSDFPWRGKTYSTETAEERAQRTGPGAGRGLSPGRTARDVSTAPMRRAEPVGPDAQAVAERLKRLPALESNEEARDRYRENTLNALTGLASVAGAPLAARIGRALGSAPARAPRATEALVRDPDAVPFKKGGKVKAPSRGRGDGIAQRGKTKGRMV
jgi:hypothetical protein